MADFSFDPYSGPEPFLCLVSDRSETREHVVLANRLASSGIRVFFARTGDRSLLPESLSGAILNAAGVILFVNDSTVSRLEFRNAVNYALALKKPVLAVKPEGYVPSHGLDMQLANVMTVPDGNAAELLDRISATGILSEAVKGDGMVKRPVPVRRYLLTALLLLIGTGLLIGSVFIIRNRVAYYNSPEYLFKNIGDSEYLDVSHYGDAGIRALSGKWIGELSAKHMGLKDVEGFRSIDMNVLDLSGNPEIVSLVPLEDCPSLYLIRISGDMAHLARDMMDRGKTVEVTE